MMRKKKTVLMPIVDVNSPVATPEKRSKLKKQNNEALIVPRFNSDSEMISWVLSQQTQ